MDIKDQVKNVAAQGRYGDTMLLHVNPIEVEALAKNMPKILEEWREKNFIHSMW